MFSPAPIIAIDLMRQAKYLLNLERTLVHFAANGGSEPILTSAAKNANRLKARKVDIVFGWGSPEKTLISDVNRHFKPTPYWSGPFGAEQVRRCVVFILRSSGRPAGLRIGVMRGFFKAPAFVASFDDFAVRGEAVSSRPGVRWSRCRSRMLQHPGAPAA